MPWRGSCRANDVSESNLKEATECKKCSDIKVIQVQTLAGETDFDLAGVASFLGLTLRPREGDADLLADAGVATFFGDPALGVAALGDFAFGVAGFGELALGDTGLASESDSDSDETSAAAGEAAFGEAALAGEAAFGVGRDFLADCAILGVLGFADAGVPVPPSECLRFTCTESLASELGLRQRGERQIVDYRTELFGVVAFGVAAFGLLERGCSSSSSSFDGDLAFLGLTRSLTLSCLSIVV